MYICDHFICDLSNSVVLATKRITMNIRYLWDIDFLLFPTIYNTRLKSQFQKISNCLIYRGETRYKSTSTPCSSMPGSRLYVLFELGLVGLICKKGNQMLNRALGGPIFFRKYWSPRTLYLIRGGTMFWGDQLLHDNPTMQIYFNSIMDSIHDSST